MKDDKARDPGQPSALAQAASAPSRILGSLRDALHAASRDDRSGAYRIGAKGDHAAPDEKSRAAKPGEPPPPLHAPASAAQGAQNLSAAEALREAKARTRDHYEVADPTTIAVRTPRPAAGHGQPGVAAGKAAGPAAPSAQSQSAQSAANDDEAPRTQALRGKPKISRSSFHQDPVVGWLVVVGGPGLGAFRPIFEGNNGIGRGRSQRIPLDFGDETISSEQQAYIRYDSVDRSFLFVPNLAKTNIVAVNDRKPTAAVKLEMMDVIRMGQTQLAFVPFCGEAFDWSELSELKE